MGLLLALFAVPLKNRGNSNTGQIITKNAFEVFDQNIAREFPNKGPES